MPKGCRPPSRGLRSGPCGRSGWSRTAGGRRGGSGGTTSSWSSPTGATWSSSAPAPAVGTGSEDDNCLPYATKTQLSGLPFRSGLGLAVAESPYIELHAHSAFSFLDGASTPMELAAGAAEHGYPAFALTDHDGVWGSMEFAHACAGFGVRAIT